MRARAVGVHEPQVCARAFAEHRQRDLCAVRAGRKTLQSRRRGEDFVRTRAIGGNAPEGRGTGLGQVQYARQPRADDPVHTLQGTLAGQAQRVGCQTERVRSVRQQWPVWLEDKRIAIPVVMPADGWLNSEVRLDAGPLSFPIIFNQPPLVIVVVVETPRHEGATRRAEDERLLVGLRIVDETTQFIESLLTQTMEHYVNGSALLTYEQHSFSLRYVIGNEVCDRLGFTSAGRPLNDVTRAGSGTCDSRSLCGVAGNDQVLLGQFQRWWRSFLGRPRT